MRRSARRTRPAGPKSAPERAISPSTSDLSVTLVTPSVSPTPEVAMRQYATPGQKPDGSMKRPMNAFILFSNEKRSELADLNPHLYAPLCREGLQSEVFQRVGPNGRLARRAWPAGL